MRLIQVLGTGCAKCDKLAANAEAAAKALGIEYRLEKVADLTRILEFGVMMTPALVVDGQVKVIGRAPTVKELKELLVGHN